MVTDEQNLSSTTDGSWMDSLWVSGFTPWEKWHTSRYLLDVNKSLCIKWDPSCTGWRTRPAPRHILTNQQRAFGGVATTSWDPTGAWISANPGWLQQSHSVSSPVLQPHIYAWFNYVSHMISDSQNNSMLKAFFYFLRIILPRSNSCTSKKIAGHSTPMLEEQK